MHGATTKITYSNILPSKIISGARMQDTMTEINKNSVIFFCWFLLFLQFRV